MRNLIKICTKCHSKRSHVVAKSKNLLSSWCRKAAIGAFVFGALLVACGDDNSGKNAGGTEEDSGIVAIADKTISGVSQKGPFVNGSSVTVQELDGESLAQTGASYEGKIKNDMGEFSVKVTKLASQYALLKANGFYRNEVTGEKSKSQVTLYALTDLSDRDEVNVNLLTHMEYERSLYLVAEGLSVGKAKKQAESEVLASFGIEGDFASAEDLSIFGTDEGAAALLAVSVLMQGDLSEADFSERLANYAADIEQDGKWDDFITATVIADWASNRSLTGTLTAIRNNIAGWGLSADVPAFEKFVNRYWWQVYSLGFCDKDREGEVKAAENALSGNNGVHFICGDGAWRKATDVEYDTYEKKCDEDGKIVFGNVSKERPYDCDGNSWRKATEVEGVLGGCVESRFDEVAEALESHYICESRQWRKATDIEKDTYKWKSGKDGDVKNGDVVETNCYVYEDSVWRNGNANDCSLELRGCTALRQDTVALGSDKVWHICDSESWRVATDIEKDTATWGAGKFDGEVRAGQTNENIYYIYEISKKAWRPATTIEKDTYDYKNNKDWIDGVGGEIKKGEITGIIYVFDAANWRVADDVEKVLGGCVTAIQDSVGKVGNSYYICNHNPTKWNVATVLQYDTYKQICSEFGQIVHGNVNADYAYFCYGDEWKRFYGNENIVYGKLIDKRDGQIYRTVKIGEQTWMAENLNYSDSTNYPSMLGGNWCYNNDNDSCEKYGRFYNWSAAVDSIYWVSKGKKYERYGFLDMPTNVQGICPDGWMMPSSEQWNKLSETIEQVYDIQAKGFNVWDNAADLFGLAMLPAGEVIDPAGEVIDYGMWTSPYYTMFWSVPEIGTNFIVSVDDAWIEDSSKCGGGCSVRCVKDEE